jgi:hypothetical protein
MRNPWKLTSFAFAALLAASVGNNLINNASADPQPRMREAIESLRAAARALEAADHDKGGHRVKALELTRAAIGEAQAGISFDNHH